MEFENSELQAWKVLKFVYIGSSLEPAGLKPGRVESMTLKLILVASWPGAWHY